MILMSRGREGRGKRQVGGKVCLENEPVEEQENGQRLGEQ